ncbi:response regulator transcription factor [Paenibacillus sp. IHBB 10380]|uniref:response regulator transcription factor n=1 Tax=Paenibacillus sp. IHBB 10380 TaxID=1566358 RepID=UPI0005CFD75C|nr:response regulator transcription factor [Paenibacillus sp. IHBB 10380]AJS58437.1 transcriptional regulator [Paenibacillus sp. IHBB 10380]
MRRILVVDDEKKIRDVISSYLLKEGYEIVEAQTGKEAIELVNRGTIDFIILDLMLPDISGEEVCQVLRQEHSTPILMLTAKVMEKDMIYGLSIGADDYMIKPFSPRELVVRVKTILRRANEGQLLADYISYNNGELIIDNVQQVVRFEDEAINVTPIEFKLLVVLAKHPGRSFTREELVEKVIGFDFEGDSRTIDQHIKNLRQKIEKTPKEPTYITTVYGVGYKFGGGKK